MIFEHNPEQCLWVVVKASSGKPVTAHLNGTDPVWLEPSKDFQPVSVSPLPPSRPSEFGERLLVIKGVDVAQETFRRSASQWNSCTKETISLKGELVTCRISDFFAWDKQKHIFHFCSDEVIRTILSRNRATGEPRISEEPVHRIYRTTPQTQILDHHPEWPQGWFPAAIECIEPVNEQFPENNQALPDVHLVEGKGQISSLESALALLASRIKEQRPLPAEIQAGEGTSFGLGEILTHPESPMELWAYAFNSRSKAEQSYRYWSRHTNFPRDPFWGACKMSAGKHPSEGWFKRLEWLFSLGAKGRLDIGHTNSIHVLAGASFSDLDQRKKAISYLREHHTIGSVKNGQVGRRIDPLLMVDSSRSTPLLRAVRSKDPAMALWLLEQQPLAAFVSDTLGSLAAAVAENLPANNGMELLQRTMELAPGAISIEDLQTAWIHAKNNPKTSEWQEALQEWLKPADIPSQTQAPKPVSVVPGYGVARTLLAQRRKEQADKPSTSKRRFK